VSSINIGCSLPTPGGTWGEHVAERVASISAKPRHNSEHHDYEPVRCRSNSQHRFNSYMVMGTTSSELAFHHRCSAAKIEGPGSAWTFVPVATDSTAAPIAKTVSTSACLVRDLDHGFDGVGLNGDWVHFEPPSRTAISLGPMSQY
jgi:hypothetical protein